jgi:CO/xanthine dehydrogenase FAD-binding subunit
VLATAATLAAEASQAVSDANGSVEYKENIVRVLVERCFRDALAAGN